MTSLGGRFALVLALLGLGLQGCDSDALPPASGFASVTGTVVDATTNAPVSGAVVVIDTVLTATTDSTGHFSIDKVPSGIADYNVQATGYAPLTSSATIEPSKPFTLNLTMSTQTKPPA
jgi:hypothetical protein